ncbi:MAG: type II toxin-antitoxin system HicA family toxin [Acinetobacter sp.]|nr:MAG: type II toxin-antitoxin system HicA family toxin [Acinetobacter sp.]
MQKKHIKTLKAIFSRPVSAAIRWKEIEALFIALGAEIQEREGSRVAVILFGQVKVFHRPHPVPTTDKGAVASVRTWLEQNFVTPDSINKVIEEHDDE